MAATIRFDGNDDNLRMRVYPDSQPPHRCQFIPRKDNLSDVDFATLEWADHNRSVLVFLEKVDVETLIQQLQAVLPQFKGE